MGKLLNGGLKAAKPLSILAFFKSKLLAIPLELTIPANIHKISNLDSTSV
jgi:hypothetical protein